MRKNYRSSGWGEFFLAWIVAVVIYGLGLVVFGLVFKIMWKIFMFGWELV